MHRWRDTGDGNIYAQRFAADGTLDPLIYQVNSAAGEIQETERLYNVLEEQTNGFFPPDTSYTSLSRVGASQKYESLLSQGVSPDSIKIVRVK